MAVATQKFSLGQIGATTALMHELGEDAEATIIGLLKRHHSCDWGDLGAEDKRTNESAIRSGERILSRYNLENGTSVYIITEWDRSSTMVMRVEDY
jgi:hypothetical protein